MNDGPIDVDDDHDDGGLRYNFYGIEAWKAQKEIVCVCVCMNASYNYLQLEA